ncbi:MAG: SDR family NAD(P)-dependent oxidoreductase [Oscillospiraceae bacterium]
MKIAVVTGASSGMGREFVRQIDEKYKLDEIWAIARREDRLNEIKFKSVIPIRAIPLDLLREKSIEYLKTLLEAEKPDVRILVNAAGFGKIGTYRDLSLQETNDMIDLNCKAAVDITIIALPFMNKNARILEVCSAASFQPLPGLNVYAASKTFLHSYSRALRWELMPRHIKVTAVCPDWVKTEFISVAKDTKNAHAVKHFPLAAKPEHVVSCALFDSAIGLPVSTYSIAFLHRFFAKFIPNEIIISFWELLRRL